MRYLSVFCFQAEDGIRDLVRSRGLGDVYKRQSPSCPTCSDGRVELIVVNGVPPYNYFIDPPIVAPSGNNFYGLPAGYYEAVSYTHLTLPTSDLV